MNLDLIFYFASENFISVKYKSAFGENGSQELCISESSVWVQIRNFSKSSVSPKFFKKYSGISEMQSFSFSPNAL